MTEREYILKSLIGTYEGQLSGVLLNLNLLLSRAQPIPEHTDYLAEVDILVGKVTDLTEKIATAYDLIEAKSITEIEVEE